MKLIPTLLALTLFARSAFTHPLDLPFELSHHEMHTLERRASGIVDVVGATGGTQPRYEIRELQSQYPTQFTLYILAMQQWQATSQSSSTGYYQIAGIHGVPRVDYNNVTQCSSCKGTDGYCTHNIVLFPAWHRAYLALFEQELVKVAKTIAKTWPSSGSAYTPAQMKAAAAVLRMPYWDWAALPPNSGDDFPSVLSSPSLTIDGPSGSETIANPLYSYHFSSSSGLVYSPFVSWPNTLRYPTSDNASATSQDSEDTSAFNSARASLQDQLYNLFTACSAYLEFSNDDASASTASCSNSLESIHNTVHTTTGGYKTTTAPTAGHMSYLSLAGFDPVFWLHHCMVDRVFALWQTLHPDSYGASQVASGASWTIAKGSTQGPDSPLEPFYHSGSTFWTTDTVQNWTVFSYTYPEYVDSSGSEAAIASYVNALYGPSATATAGSSKRTASPEPVGAATLKPAEKRGIFHPPPGATAQNGSTFEYIANIQTSRYALGGSYTIFLFLGPPASEVASSWITDANLVGPMGVLSQDGMKESEIIITGAIPLTRALTAKLGSGILDNLSEALVGPLLQDLLVWRVLGPDGTGVDPSTIPNFVVSVYATTATQPTTYQTLPKYSKFFSLAKATKGKKGGNSTIVL